MKSLPQSRVLCPGKECLLKLIWWVLVIVVDLFGLALHTGDFSLQSAGKIFAKSGTGIWCAGRPFSQHTALFQWEGAWGFPLLSTLCEPASERGCFQPTCHVLTSRTEAGEKLCVPASANSRTGMAEGAGGGVPIPNPGFVHPPSIPLTPQQGQFSFIFRRSPGPKSSVVWWATVSTVWPTMSWFLC